MARVFHVALLGLVTISCGRTSLDESGALASNGVAASAHPRQPYFTPGSANYGYYEGGKVSNGCTRDQDCSISGCSRSTCAAEAMAIVDNGFCQERMLAQGPEPLFAECGCLRGECRWYFESDYDRPCTEDNDCAGLGAPPGGPHHKAIWQCAEGACSFSEP